MQRVMCVDRHDMALAHTQSTTPTDGMSLMFCNTWREKLGASRLGYSEDDIGSVSTYTQNRSGDRGKQRKFVFNGNRIENVRH